MWSRIPICFCPQLWLSVWLVGSATTTVYRLHQMLVPLVPLRLRSPLLTLHVSTLKLSPHAGKRPHYEMHRPHLRLVKHDLEGN